MGLGCFVWVPLSIGLGRRPTLLIATLLLLIATIGASQAKTYYQYVVASCFLGLGNALGLSLVSVTSSLLQRSLLITIGISYGD